MTADLSRRTAVVTGGASGIGRAAALAFARAGADIAVVDRDADGAAQTAREIETLGRQVLVRASDVGDAPAVDADAAAIIARFGRIDILLTAAGWSCGGTVTTTPAAEWARVFRTNVDGTWLWARAVIPTMQAQRRGAIITMASQLALAGGRGNSAYIASKGAVLSLTRTMALDYVADGIRVNALAPGAIDTPMLSRAFERAPDPAAARAAAAARHAMQRIGKAEEIAAAAVFLASDAASFITGATLPVDGGWLAA